MRAGEIQTRNVFGMHCQTRMNEKALWIKIKIEVAKRPKGRKPEG